MQCMTVLWKKRSMILVSVSLLVMTVFVPVAQGEVSGTLQALPPQTKALVLYESKTEFGETYPLVIALDEYLGHFNIQVNELERSKWTPGSLDGYDYILYLGDRTANLPAKLLLEMSQAHVLFWFDQNIEQFSNLKKWPNFRNLGLKNEFVSLHYRGQDLPISPSEEFNCAYPIDADDLVIADNLYERTPFAWKKDNVVYISKLDFQNPLNLILAGIMEETIGGNQVEGRHVLLRIEDIQPLTSPDTLAVLINALAVARVPFALAVTPTTIINGKSVTLVDYPNLLEVLHTVEANGGCIILKGYEVTQEEELEYWNTNNDRPLEESKENIALSKMGQGIDLLAGLNLYPVAFEVPGSSMSQNGYQTLAQHFTTLSGTVQLTDTSASLPLDVPFAFRSKRAGMLVYPENLGFYNPKLLDPAGAILNKARELTVVPVCTAGLYFHSYLQADNLLPIIKGLRQLNYQFVDMRATNYQVTTPNISIVSQDGYRHISTNIPAIWVDQSLSGIKLSLRNWFYVLTVLLILIVSSFLFILSRLRRSKSNMYEQRRH